ncbi:MAG: ChbG/HpnK family deacetylase [Acidobacteriota bacterium]
MREHWAVHGSPAKSYCVDWLTLRSRGVRAAGLATCDQARGLFESGVLTEQKLLRLLGSLPEGTTELMCHPGSRTKQRAKGTDIGNSIGTTKCVR